MENGVIEKKTVKVRRVNNAAAAAMQHFTLTRVENHPEKCFGFANSDDGEVEIYVPAFIIKAEQMTAADVGAGFSCMTKGSTDTAAGTHPTAVHPIKWDGDAEEIEVDVTPSDEDNVDVDELSHDFDRLVSAGGSLVDNTSGPLEKFVTDMDAMVTAQAKAYKSAKAFRDHLERFVQVLDTVAPENKE